MTALCDGGTRIAWTEALIVTLVANTRGNPTFSICGIITDPIADVSATEDPEIPDRNVVAMMLTADNPPRTRTTPTRTFANATSRFAMPPSDMIAPASTKNGIVSIATLDTPSEILSITASSGMPIHIAPAIAARPSEYAIGIPSAKKMNRLPSRIAISMARGVWRCYSNAAGGACAASPVSGGGPSVRCSTMNRNRIAPPIGIGR